RGKLRSENSSLSSEGYVSATSSPRRRAMRIAGNRVVTCRQAVRLLRTAPQDAPVGLRGQPLAAERLTRPSTIGEHEPSRLCESWMGFRFRTTLSRCRDWRYSLRWEPPPRVVGAT